MLLGRFGSRSAVDLGSKIDVNMEISDILESMLSLAWEHSFSMFWGWIWDGF